MGNMFKKVKKKEQGKVSLRWIMNNSGRLLVVCVVLGYTTRFTVQVASQSYWWVGVEKRG